MQRQSAQEIAYGFLHSEIVSGRLAGGTRLKPERIAERLGISRMPVREAIRQLDAEGYVTIRPNRGAVVTERTAGEAMELFEMRSVLEGLAVRLAVRRIADDDIDELDLMITRMHRVAAESMQWVERHEEFHDRLCTLSGRPRLVAEVRRLRDAVKPYLKMYCAMHSDPELPGHEHEMIVDALRDRDARRAERLIVSHVMGNAQEIAACLASPRAGTAVARVTRRMRQSARV